MAHATMKKPLLGSGYEEDENTAGADHPVVLCCGCALMPSGLFEIFKTKSGNVCHCFPSVLCRAFTCLIDVLLTPFLLVLHFVRIYLGPCLLIELHRCFGFICCGACNLIGCASYWKYRDFFFPPSDLSLGDLDIVKHKQPCCVQSCCCCNWVCTCHDPLGDATVEWKRLGEMHDLSGKVGDDDGPIQLFAGGIDAGDIAQGALGDCWLLAAVAATAEEHPEIIKSLFLTQEAEPCGCYRLRLYDIKHYRWRTFTIDDRIPVDAHGRPYFSKPNGDEMWVALLEKAFAKMWGSYAALEGGWASVAFEAFTGNERVDLKLDTFLGAGGDAHKEGRLFDIVGKALEKGVLMCAGSSHRGGGDTHRSGNGIIQGHAYTVLDCIVTSDGMHLLQLRNPWGADGEWTGEYSEQDEAHAEWMAHAGETYRHRKPETAPGKFWMPFHDFCTEYTTLYMCATFKSINNLELDVEGGACGPSCGVCKGCYTFFCCCEGARAMWAPERQSTYKVLVNDCGLDVKDHVFHGRTKLGDISENLAKSNPLKLDAGVDNV